MEQVMQIEVFSKSQVLECIQALQGAKDLIASLDSALLVAAWHGETGTSELRELNTQRLATIDRALVMLKGE